MAANNQFDSMFKILLVGGTEVGKTAFLMRYTDDTFNPAYVSTVGIDFKTKVLISDDKRIKLQIWDTAGQERYQSVTTAYYKGAMGFIIMFDLTSEESYQTVNNWYSEIRELSSEKATVVLVGNKSDLKETRIVNTMEAMELAQSLGIRYIESSAKDGSGVNEAMEIIVQLIKEEFGATADN